MVTEIWVNNGPGNGLLPDGTKPSPEPMLTCNQRGPLELTCGQLHKNILDIRHYNVFKKYTFENIARSTRDQWDKSWI